jgi:dUTP pyrophosphatase
MEVKIARINPDAHLPEYKTEGAGCFDIEAIENQVIQPGETILMGTGLVVQVPEGYFLAIAPRSSLAKTGLEMPHSFGILDSDYCGPEDEMKILLKNVTDKPVKLEKYQRVAQGYLNAVPKVIWKEITRTELKRQSRGGYGSTGKK